MADTKLSLRGHKVYLTRLKDFVVAINLHTATRSNYAAFCLPIEKQRLTVAHEMFDCCADQAEAGAVTKETEPIFD
ncbi:unnamed protein product [Allacma fusca]|uniref:Uncharacterized protein n=1 Tax=Allacma fusca TaxID=39272 RepID=A0A8J2L780_9HEXA|nr:unnamed protein product [Allacma fusca]